MQYLGAKHRSIDEIIQECSWHYKDGYILDLFAGSTIVSQAFSSTGKKTISNDIQRFSSTFAKSTLQIDFEEKDLHNSLNFLDKLNVHCKEYKFYNLFETFIHKEEQLIKLEKIRNLLSLYESFPTLWNENIIFSNEFQVLHEEFQNNLEKPGFNIGPIVTLHYAGTYFGIKQSLDIDYLRVQIEKSLENEIINNWQYNMLLTCLLKVVSKVVFSAGKHFAQPINTKGTFDTPILNKRLILDRSYNIFDLFQETVVDFIDHCKNVNHCKDNIALTKTMEELLTDELDLPTVDIIYADPPYTAQQYSRFYHIPEVIIEYRIPKLQIHKGSITKGIYPDKKFKSRFCSKLKVVDAFKDLFKLTKKLDSTLILSYSYSKNDSTGNDRMIDLDTLEVLQKDILPNYTMSKIEFDFEYKQLNKSNNIDNDKNDKEILIVYSKN